MVPEQGIKPRSTDCYSRSIASRRVAMVFSASNGSKDRERVGKLAHWSFQCEKYMGVRGVIPICFNELHRATGRPSCKVSV